MRGALEPLAGIGELDVERGRKTFWVTYDPGELQVDRLLAALSEAGEPAAAAPQ